MTLPGRGGTVSFQYDPFGRRICKSGASGTTIYVYDGDNIEEEVNATGALQERWTYGPGVDEPLVGQRQPKIFYYEADGIGSVTSLAASDCGFRLSLARDPVNTTRRPNVYPVEGGQHAAAWYAAPMPSTIAP